MNNNFESLKEKLEKDFSWPSVYFFKFIIPADNKKLALLESLFGEEAKIQIKQSTNGNYISFSAKELMLSAQSVIDRYIEAQKIEGIMSL